VSGRREVSAEAATKPAGAACESCGGHEVVEMAGKFLCAECVAVAGSACAGPVDELDE
jgi:hypothetical protein